MRRHRETHRSPAERVLARCVPVGDCLIYTGYLNEGGYGMFSWRGNRGASQLAHRIVWEAEHGPVPPGYLLHHECERPACCNTRHQRLVTKREHWHAHNVVTHCKHGHPFDAENTYVDRIGRRHCRACKRESERRRRARDR